MDARVNRRDFLKIAAGGAVALSVGAHSAGAAAADSPKKVRMAFLGVGDRGTGLLKVALLHPDVDIPCICDINEQHLNRALDLVEKARGYRPEGFSKGPYDYRRMLKRPGFDAVLIATPQELHAEQAVDSMHADKFVGSEVPACTTIDECWDLVEARQKSGTGYMMLENYVYSEPVMQITNMAEKGVFGDLTYGYGAYIHEIRSMRFNPDGSLTWRGHNVADHTGIVYPTHAIGPVCKWMKVNEQDRLVSVVTLASKSAANHDYAVEKFGAESAAAKVHFKNGDTNNGLVKTEKGRLIEIRYDTASPRPSGMGQYALQGTKASYEAAFGLHKLFIEGRSPEHTWEDLEKYRDEYEHPYWKEHGEQAKKSGHGGGDFFVIRDFIDAVRTGDIPIDVYDAVSWSSIRPLSSDSIAGGGKPTMIPDFKHSKRGKG